jgi:phage terminase small subunit
MARSNAATALPAGEVQEGPAMAALTPKQKRYVIALFEAPKSHGAMTFAARRAGYGTATSSRQSLSQMAYQVQGDPKVQAAIAEVSQQYITALGPHAVRALKKVLDNPSHRDFGRALGIVTDRVAPSQSTHTVKVEGEIKLSAQETAHVLARIEELAAKFAVQIPAPKIIEGELA